MTWLVPRESKNMNLFFSAVENNKLDSVKKYLIYGVDINMIDDFGYSALHIASSKGFIEMGLLLIESNINLNLQDKNGKTILHYVAEYNQLEIAKAVIYKNASLSIADNFGNEPLWTAVFNDKGRNERIEIIKLFLDNGANYNHKNKVDKSPKDIVTIAKYDNLVTLFP